MGEPDAANHLSRLAGWRRHVSTTRVAFKMAQSLRELVVRSALKRSLQNENPSRNVETEKRQKIDGKDW
jgi:hypothetical protein